MIHATQRGQRWARERPVIVDIGVAVLATVIGLSELAADDITDTRDPDLLAVVLILAAGTSLVWRRVAPLTVLATVTLMAVPVYLRDYGTFLTGLGLTAIYSAAAHGRNRRQTWLAIVAAVGVLFAAANVTLMDNGEGYSYANAINMIVFCTSAAAAGGIVRNRHEIFVSAQTRAEHAEATRLAEAERAVARERLRIARDMHDVVAHSMSVMAVQAAAAQEITRTQPDRAILAMQTVERTGRQALNEMRRMLGVLRGDDADTALTPQPTLANIADTVAQSNEAGLTTALEVTGERRELPPGIEVAAFRIVQEALTNVRKHGGSTASATVRLDYGPISLGVEIIDDGAGAVSSLSRTGGGNGLIGMRERVEIYNGDFDAGPRPGGGFAVHVQLPTAGDDETQSSVASAETRRGDEPQ
ncbi:MAG: two-component sensor histidine kinase [Acidimicrobiales bacterium]|nr:MAG: two-component sensor histidine kinase [Acidimicrobiales bacterium]